MKLHAVGHAGVSRALDVGIARKQEMEKPRVRTSNRAGRSSDFGAPALLSASLLLMMVLLLQGFASLRGEKDVSNGLGRPGSAFLSGHEMLPTFLWCHGGDLGGTDKLSQPPVTVQIRAGDERQSKSFVLPDGTNIAIIHEKANTPIWKRAAGGAAGIVLATLLTLALVDVYGAVKRRIQKRRAKKSGLGGSFNAVHDTAEFGTSPEFGRRSRHKLVSDSETDPQELLDGLMDSSDT